jgi:hypothetical protein
MEGIDQRVLQTHFGTFLKMQRDQWGVRQREVLLYFPGWTQANYSRLESNAIAPAFDQLLPLYSALLRAGVQWNASERQRFLALARKRIAEKKRQTEQHQESEWAELRYQMAEVDFFPDEPAAPATPWTPPRPLLAETRHLLGREAWHSELIGAVQTRTPKKLLVVQGPVGIGKSSALHRLIQHFIGATDPAYHVIWIPLLPVERGAGPESSLEVVLGTILAESGSPALTPEMASWQQRQRLALAMLEQSARPVVILVDNAESVLTGEGTLSACWEEFLDHFLRHQHKATLIMATKEWPGWSGRSRALVCESMVPPLDMATSIVLLQQQGLESVPVEQLQEVWRRVGGIPLSLEWVASLAQNPHQLNQWQSFDIVEEEHGQVGRGEKGEREISQRLTRLLTEPTLLRGHLASKLRPLLERIIEKRLSAEARALLDALAVCNVPLGKAALQALCEHPGLINELRNASLLVSYAHRVQVLPIVAAVVTQGMTIERITELEEDVIQALQRWIEEGTIAMQETGAAITELAMFLLKHHRLLEAAELLIRYGWLGFNQGHAPRVAYLAEEVMSEFVWQESTQTNCGGIILNNLLSPFLGKTIDAARRIAYFQSILDVASTGAMKLQIATETYLIHHLISYRINRLQFDEAQAILDIHNMRLESLQHIHFELRASFIREQALLFSRRGEYMEEQGAIEIAQSMREETIALYKEYLAVLSNQSEPNLLKKSLITKRLAACQGSLSYHLNRNGQYHEALLLVGQSIDLMEQGYCNFGALAASYGEKADILAKLGHFREALLLDEKALTEIQRCVDAGDTLSQEERWIYLVNRGCLYLRLGKIDEAEQLLHQALPHIHPRRRIYRMFAKKGLEEIEQWRKTKAIHYQLDWRWVDRYRQLDAYDTYWWWAQAGPFNEEEQREWNRLFTPDVSEDRKELLGKQIAQSRQRELSAAFAEQREPRLHYPALNIDEVRSRISSLIQLDTEIQRDEPHPIVRRLYHGTIEDEVAFLQMIEATYEGDNKRFLLLNCRLYPDPTAEEMAYALSRVRRLLQQGLDYSETVQDCQHLLHLLREQLHLTIDLSVGKEDAPVVLTSIQKASPPAMISAQAAKRFFEALLQEEGFKDWQVVIDPKATGPRIEAALRMFFLQDGKISVERIKHYVFHELAGHVARAFAGEHSLLGLLGINTKGYASTEEGIALYQERQAVLPKQTFDDFALWLGTLAVGFARGVMTPPQTFLSLYSLFKSLLLLYHMLLKPDRDREKALALAQKNAITRCLRVFRGVPDLEKAGVCLSSDIVYLRGLWKIERAVAKDTGVLDRLAVGKIALELLPEIQELELIATSHPFRSIVHGSDLDAFILSFERSDEFSVS